VIGLVAHTADHIRRGTGVLMPEVYWVGAVTTVIGVGIIVLVVIRHRLTPLPAALFGRPIAIAFPIDVVAYGDGGASALIKFEGDFRFTEPGEEPRFLDASEQQSEELTAVLSLRRDRIRSAHASEDGQLVVEFASGRRLEAGPNQAYENWQVSGPGFQLIANPGGGVAVLDSGTTQPDR
jgi:hypothetical protein